ncbi:L-threonylcarbamoyladenylate synthase [Crocinitomix catalasitica]|uniref:L-threonylcarbamoyladenylate synthase n=1 Tax=Crocinitomix catalasitica TaxID=184607 RepID=UPI000486775E|nr:L-threonylcarbamoyladenylate synthase [Crocinitomix catalasitica]
MKEVIEKAAEIIQSGGVILYPTDTIWGLGCDPRNEKAVQKICEIKKRTADKSLIVLVPNEALLQRYVKEIPEVCYDLIDFATEPLTIVYPKGQFVAPQVLGPDGSIAIRLTKNDFCKKLMFKTKSGLISTSANISNVRYPGDFENLSDDIKNNVDYIVNLPLENKNFKPSQIIKIGSNGEVAIIRK